MQKKRVDAPQILFLRKKIFTIHKKDKGKGYEEKI